MALLDWWRMGQQDPNSVYNMAPGGTFTTMLGAPDPTPDPPPIPAPPGSGPIATIMGGAPRQPEIQTDPDTARTTAPPPPPPVGTPKQPEILTDPDASRTAPPAAPLPPARKIPEVLTKTPGTPDERLTPTAASTAAQTGNIWDEWMKRVKDPKMGPVIAALAKGMGHGANSAPVAQKAPFPQLDHAPNISGQLGTIASQAGQKLGEIRQGLKVFGPKPKKARQDDPHDREQDTYDFRRLKGRG
jgi:hypothetical protein